MDIIGICEDGNYFYLNATSDSARLTHEVWGHIHLSNGFLHKINACDLDLEKIGENGPIPKHFSIRFSAKRRNFHAIVHLLPDQFENFLGRPWSLQTKIYPSHLTLNSQIGRIILVATKTYHDYCPLSAEVSVPHLGAACSKLSSAQSEKLVLGFNEEACRLDSLVGGKGSSLALLSSNAKSFPIKCQVPDGFCVTVNAWKVQTSNNEDIDVVFKRLQDVATGVVEGKLEECCTQAENFVSSLPVDPKIQDNIRKALKV